VIAVDKDEEGVSGTARIINGNNGQCYPFVVDVSSREQMEALAQQVLSRWRRLDLLINNVGVGIGAHIQDIELKDWERIIGANLLGHIYGIHFFLQQMLERGAGHIVNISSTSGLVALPLLAAPYITTKFAVAGLSEALRFEMARYGIGVTTVCPGGMRTNLLKNAQVNLSGEREKKLTEILDKAMTSYAMKPEKAAKKIIKGIKRNKPLVLFGVEAYSLYYLKRFFPWLYYRLGALGSKIL
jgi:NAD(P)-dependent dehydrogenase (short-subunit alcohol dehydrogenase family)